MTVLAGAKTCISGGDARRRSLHPCHFPGQLILDDADEVITTMRHVLHAASRTLPCQLPSRVGLHIICMLPSIGEKFHPPKKIIFEPKKKKEPRGRGCRLLL